MRTQHKNRADKLRNSRLSAALEYLFRVYVSPGLLLNCLSFGTGSRLLMGLGRARCVAVVCAASMLLINFKPAFAQGGRFFELTLSGSYETRYTQYRENQRKSYGLELLIPLSSFLQLSAGHTFVEDKDLYNEEYRTFQEEQGVTLPEGPLVNISTYADTTGNAVLFYNFGYVRPSIFGGVLLRTYCEENPTIDYGCAQQEPTWNAGAGLSMIITWNLRLNVSHRVSPSVTYKTDKKLDSLTSLGLTLMY